MQRVKKKEGIGLGEDDGDGMEAWEDVSEGRLRVERDGKRKQKQETRERKDSGDLDLNSPPAFSRLRLNFRSGPQIVTRRDGVVSNSIRIANDSRIFSSAVNYSIRDVQCPLSAVMVRGEQCCLSRRPFASPSERERETVLFIARPRLLTICDRVIDNPILERANYIL
ncbi:uncharacterized protein BO88DRAFT_146098 [Aspergillus vadensis CBS 113365]|uniref:Uncharacterized protein n=1 Tax=Aspergillus vadensis (strain CBS 113365 / IMI 142717 / IBT 24658) TaxID=1448311 RepID=A0A319AZI9_ASPVC|nr:hypothetical protein BO88DRAFT_146098 [Aspergillus vadensis CBS 113365]PYH65245.1 hypothetical protein BO88DRAFT_146098 [Aspergillus vadensis CBS 113365]